MASEDPAPARAGRRFYVYTALYRHLELKRCTRLYSWPERVGIDEHYFRRDKRLDVREFVTMVVDHSNGRLLEVAEGRRGIDVEHAVRHVPGRENVRFVKSPLASPSSVDPPPSVKSLPRPVAKPPRIAPKPPKQKAPTVLTIGALWLVPGDHLVARVGFEPTTFGL